jgi:hypothetical protein
MLPRIRWANELVEHAAAQFPGKGAFLEPGLMLFLLLGFTLPGRACRRPCPCPRASSMGLLPGRRHSPRATLRLLPTEGPC